MRWESERMVRCGEHALYSPSGTSSRGAVCLSGLSEHGWQIPGPTVTALYLIVSDEYVKGATKVLERDLYCWVCEMVGLQFWRGATLKSYYWWPVYEYGGEE